jgi:thymidylate kinase
MDVTARPVPKTTSPSGRFLTLEGIDGAGKSSHLIWAAEYLRAQGIEVITTRSPVERHWAIKSARSC